jgi:hypothetical protein
MEETCRPAYLFPVPCKFFAAIAGIVQPHCSAPVAELKRRHVVFLARNNNRRERTVLLRIDGFDVIAIPQPSRAPGLNGIGT